MVSAPHREDVPLYQANYGGIPADFLISANTVGDHCYYRQPNGWITLSPIGRNNNDLHRYQDEGWTPLLRQYGAVDFTKEYYVHHPFEVLFLRGGAEEMPVEQIKALGYDRTPPTLPRCNLMLGAEHGRPTGRPVHFDRCWMGAPTATFPQLGDAVPASVPPCEFCERDDFTSRRGREQHMRVLHIDELKEITSAREMAAGIKDGVRDAIAGVQGIAGRNLAGSGFAVAGMEARPFGCTLCGEMFEKMRGSDGLEAHVKLHEDGTDG